MPKPSVQPSWKDLLENAPASVGEAFALAAEQQAKHGEICARKKQRIKDYHQRDVSKYPSDPISRKGYTL